MIPALLLAAWPLLASLAARVTVLFLAALLADRILHRRSASLRHAVWRATLAGTIALGVGTVALPGWQVEILPQQPPQVVPRAHLAKPVTAFPFAASRDDGIGTASGSTGDTPPVTAALVALWLTVSGVLLLRVLIDLRALARSNRSAHLLHDGPAIRLADSIARALGIARPVRVLVHDSAVTPHTFGLWHATLVLPHQALCWPRDRQERVITHELGHVQRGDALECVLMRVVLAILWFHPGAWTLSRRLAATREAACDDIVLLRGARASDYATDLLDAVRSARALQLPMAVPAMARRTELRARLTDVLDPTRPRTLDARTPRRLLGVTCMLLALPLAAVRPVHRHAPDAVAAVITTAARRPSAARAPRPRPTASQRDDRQTVARQVPRPRVRAATLVLAERLASLDSICAVTNGRTRGELLVTLADQWVEDARFLDAYFRVLDGIPDARVRADVVTRALVASRTSRTRDHARAIIDGFPDKGLRDAMSERLDLAYSTVGGSH